MEDPINYPPAKPAANSYYVLIRDNALGRLRHQFSSWADMMKYRGLAALGGGGYKSGTASPSLAESFLPDNIFSP